MASGGGTPPQGKEVVSTPSVGGVVPRGRWVPLPSTATKEMIEAMRRRRAVEGGNPSGLEELPQVSRAARDAIEEAAPPVREEATLPPEVGPDDHTIFIF
jgi:hypothetical protein